MGVFSALSKFTSGVYEGVKESLPSKAVGAVVGATGSVLASGVTAAASPLVYGGLRASGKSEEEAKQITRTARQTAIRRTREFGTSIGKEGAASSLTGTAGKVANVAMTAPSFEAAGKAAKEGRTASAIGNAALGLLGIYGAKQGPTLRQSASGAVEAATGLAQKRPSLRGVGTVAAERTLPQSAKTMLTRSPKAAAQATDDLDNISRVELDSAAKTVRPKTQKKSVAIKAYMDDARLAKNDPAAPTPLEKAGQKASGVLTSMNGLLKKVGQQKTQAIKAADESGVLFRDTDGITTKFEQDLSDRLGASINTVDNNVDISSATGRESIITEPSDKKLITEFYNDLQGIDGRNIRAVDDLVDKYQSKLDYSVRGATPVSGPVDGLIKSTLSQLNDSLKKQVGGDYIDLNQSYSAIVKLRDWLNRNLGPDAIRDGALMKRVFSPSDAGTKRYFEEIKKLTGVDLIQEAWMAKLAMDAVNDPRSKSLLEEAGVAAEAAQQLANVFIPSTGKVTGFLRAAQRAIVNDKAIETAMIKIAEGAEVTPKEVDLLEKNPAIRQFFDIVFGDVPTRVLMPQAVGLQSLRQDIKEQQEKESLRRDLRGSVQQPTRRIDPEALRRALEEAERAATASQAR